MRGSPTDAAGAGSLDVAAPDYLWFVDLALREMAGIVEQLADRWVDGAEVSRGGLAEEVLELGEDLL